MKTTSQMLRHKKVLMIDEDETDAFILNTTIQSALFADEVVVKAGMGQAIDYLKGLGTNIRRLPDIIFLDLEMLLLDDLYFLEEFSHLDPAVTSHCRIVLLTHAIHRHKEAASVAKNNPAVKNILMKPVTVEELEEIN